MASQEIEEALKQQARDKRLEDLERQVSSLLSDREKAMRWGILTLGAAVLAMGSYILNLVTGHMK